MDLQALLTVCWCAVLMLLAELWPAAFRWKRPCQKKKQRLYIRNNDLFWGRPGFDGGAETKVAGRGAAGLVKSGKNVIANDDYAYAYAA